MTVSHVDDEQELLRLMRLIMDSCHEDGVANLNRYIHDDFLISYYNYEQDKKGILTKEQIIGHWGKQKAESGTAIASEQRVHLSGDTAVIFALITDTFHEPSGDRISKTWVSDVWVKRDGEWRWFASHETLLK
jgi:hypothetical protein